MCGFGANRARLRIVRGSERGSAVIQQLLRVASLLRSQGFTHVLLYDLGVQLEREWRDSFLPADWEELERFKEEQLQLIESFDAAYTLYAIENTIVHP